MDNKHLLSSTPSTSTLDMDNKHLLSSTLSTSTQDMSNNSSSFSAPSASTDIMRIESILNPVPQEATSSTDIESDSSSAHAISTSSQPAVSTLTFTLQEATPSADIELDPPYAYATSTSSQHADSSVTFSPPGWRGNTTYEYIPPIPPPPPDLLEPADAVVLYQPLPATFFDDAVDYFLSDVPFLPQLHHAANEIIPSLPKRLTDDFAVNFAMLEIRDFAASQLREALPWLPDSALVDVLESMIKAASRKIDEHEPLVAAAESRMHFFKLSAEMRNRIYEDALIVKRNKTEYESDVVDIVYDSPPGLLETCRQVRKEALPIYYSQNTFRAVYHSTEGPLVPSIVPSIDLWAQHLGREKMSMIKDFEISFRMCSEWLEKRGYSLLHFSKDTMLEFILDKFAPEHEGAVLSKKELLAVLGLGDPGLLPGKVRIRTAFAGDTFDVFDDEDEGEKITELNES